MSSLNDGFGLQSGGGGGTDLVLYKENPVSPTPNTVTGDNAVAIGIGCISSGTSSHSEGEITTASGNYSHAEGSITIASGNYSHAEGSSTTASGEYSHAEGLSTIASGNYSHAEGSSTIASGNYSHSEGSITTASGEYSHAEGEETTASGRGGHSEGSGTIASGNFSHAQNEGTRAHAYASTAIGRYNVGGGDSVSWIVTDPLFEIGNGTDDLNRANALTVYKNGYIKPTIPSYVDDAAADADTDLPSGGLYKLNAGRAIYQKP